jgi:carbon monoxide dehydrogenase subunit G
MDFTNTVTIDRRAQEVFRFVSDLENVPKWNYAIIATRKTSDGPVDVGTTYRQVRSAPTRSEEQLRVTEFESGRRFAVQGDLGPFVGTLTYEFEDADGRTRLTNTASLEARGLVKIAAPIASARIREAVAENLGALKQLMEQRDTTPQ